MSESVKTKCISYSLFGYGQKETESGFQFNSFLRGLMLCRRMNLLLYPDWAMIVNMDPVTYEAYRPLFDNIDIEIRIHEPAKLCKAMLWRLAPAWEKNRDGTWKWTHLLCRDLDSPATYREVQAVTHWMNKGTALHAITDSDSHNIPLMGGMIGFRPQHFCDRFGPTFNDMMMLAGNSGIDFGQKGTDQTFLNHFIYPSFAQPGSDNITQHYFYGMPNTFLRDYNTCNCKQVLGHVTGCPNDIETGLPFEMKESNETSGHIGAAGAYMTQLNRFFFKFRDRFEWLMEIEKQFPVFYWTKDGHYD
jgi:hypothetical protein